MPSVNWGSTVAIIIIAIVGIYIGKSSIGAKFPALPF